MKQKLIKSSWYVGVAAELDDGSVYTDSEFSVIFGLKYTINKFDWTIIDLT